MTNYTPNHGTGPHPTKTPLAKFGAAATVLVFMFVLALGLLSSIRSAPSNEYQQISMDERRAAAREALGDENYDDLMESLANPVETTTTTTTTTTTSTIPTDALKMPDVIGLEYNEALLVIFDYDVTVDRLDTPSSEMPAGHVISTSPEPGDIVTESAIVRITVSSGPAGS